MSLAYLRFQIGGFDDLLENPGFRYVMIWRSTLSIEIACQDATCKGWSNQNTNRYWYYSLSDHSFALCFLFELRFAVCTVTILSAHVLASICSIAQAYWTSIIISFNQSVDFISENCLHMIQHLHMRRNICANQAYHISNWLTFYSHNANVCTDLG